MLNIEYLRSFVTLAEVGKYQLAADMLYCSQSTLSKQIQVLEKELGVQLFDRSTHHVALTEYATVLLPHARKILELRDKMDRDIGKIQRSNQKQHINIGCSPVIPLYRLTNHVGRFLRENPCEMQILNQDVARLKEMFSRGECDLIILYTSKEPPDWQEEDIFSFDYTADRLAAVLPVQHHLAERSSVSVADLQEEAFVQVGKDSLAETFGYRLRGSQRSFQPEVSFSVDSVHQMLSLIRRGMAVSVMGEQSVKHFSNAGTVTIPIEPRIPLFVKGFYHASSEENSTAANLVSYLSRIDE